MLRLVSTSVKTQFYECRKIKPPLIDNCQKLVILNQFKSTSIAFLFSVFVLKLSSASNVLNSPDQLKKSYKIHSDDSEKRIKIFFPGCLLFNYIIDSKFHGQRIIVYMFLIIKR